MSFLPWIEKLYPHPTPHPKKKHGLTTSNTAQVNLMPVWFVKFAAEKNIHNYVKTFLLKQSFADYSYVVIQYISGRYCFQGVHKGAVHQNEDETSQKYEVQTVEDDQNSKTVSYSNLTFRNKVLYSVFLLWNATTVVCLYKYYYPRLLFSLFEPLCRTGKQP